MKKVILLFSLFCFSAYAAERGTVVKSSISKVTVYQQGAQIQQKANYSVPKGITTLVIEGVSPSIDPGSIQINATGNIVLLDSKIHRILPGARAHPEPLQ